MGRRESGNDAGGGVGCEGDGEYAGAGKGDRGRLLVSPPLANTPAFGLCGSGRAGAAVRWRGDEVLGCD